MLAALNVTKYIKHILAITALSLHVCTVEPLLKDTEKGAIKFHLLRGQPLYNSKISWTQSVQRFYCITISYSHTVMLTC